MCSRAFIGLSPYYLCFVGCLETGMYSWKEVGSEDENIQLDNVEFLVKEKNVM